MPPLKKKQKRLRTIGSQGGYSKKIRQTTESENQSSSIPANIPVFQKNNSIPHQPGSQLSILAEEDTTWLDTNAPDGQNSPSRSTGLSRTTIWRRARKEREKERQQEEEGENNSVDVTTLR